jgi:exopolysaccharide production protein ExoQ
MRAILNKIYFYFVLSCAGGVIPRIFGGHAGIHAGGEASIVSGGDHDPLLLFFNLTLGFMTILLAYAKLPQILAMLSELKGLLLLYLYAGASILWSADPTTTFRNIVYLLLFLVAAAYIVTSFGFDELIEHFGKAMASFALLSIPAQLLLPPPSYENSEWAGAFLHKNELGAAMAFGIVSLMAGKRPRGLNRAAAILPCFALLLLSGSAGAFVCAFAGIGTLVVLRLRGHARFMVLTVLAAALILPMMFVRNFISIAMGLVGKDPTLTGRTAVWEVVVGRILAHPLLGYGQGGFWASSGGSVGAILGTWQPQHAHNGVLEICLNLGLLGLGLVILVLFAAFRRAQRLKHTIACDARIWGLAIFIMLLLHAADEATFLQLNCAWFAFLLAVFSLCSAEQKIRWYEMDQVDLTFPAHVGGDELAPLPN